MSSSSEEETDFGGEQDEGQRHNITLEDITSENLIVLKRINSVVLPTPYSEKWYRESLDVGQLAKFACYNGIPVGAIRCMLELNGTVPARVYIMTIAVLAPYREYGIGSQLLEHILNTCKRMFVHEVYVHVWTQNAPALEWYERREFVKNELIRGYYHKMKPPGDAWVMTKRF